jgi:hypothetical protein
MHVVVCAPALSGVWTGMHVAVCASALSGVSTGMHVVVCAPALSGVSSTSTAARQAEKGAETDKT